MASFFKSREAFEWFETTPSFPRRSLTVTQNSTNGMLISRHCDEKKFRSCNKQSEGEREGALSKCLSQELLCLGDDVDSTPLLTSSSNRCSSRSTAPTLPYFLGSTTPSHRKIKGAAELMRDTEDANMDAAKRPDSRSSFHFAFFFDEDVNRENRQGESCSDFHDWLYRACSSPLLKVLASGIYDESSSFHTSDFTDSVERAAVELRALFPFLSLSTYSTSPTSNVFYGVESRDSSFSVSNVLSSQHTSDATLWYYVPRVLSRMLSHFSAVVLARKNLLLADCATRLPNNSLHNNCTPTDCECARRAPLDLGGVYENQQGTSAISGSFSPPSRSIESLLSCEYRSFERNEKLSKRCFTTLLTGNEAEQHQRRYEANAAIILWIKLLECVLLEAVSPVCKEEGNMNGGNSTGSANPKNPSSSPEIIDDARSKKIHGANEDASAASRAPSAVVCLLSQQLIKLLDFLYACHEFDSKYIHSSTTRLRGTCSLDGGNSSFLSSSEESGRTMKALIKELLTECVVKVLGVATHSAVGPLIAGLQCMVNDGDVLPKSSVSTIANILDESMKFSPGLKGNESKILSTSYSTFSLEESNYFMCTPSHNFEKKNKPLRDTDEAAWIRKKRWHPFVTPELALKVFQRALIAVKAVKQHPAMMIASSNYFSPSDARRRQDEQEGTTHCYWGRHAALHYLHQCVLCPFSEEWRDAEEVEVSKDDKRKKISLLGSIAVATMSCMRFARVADLVALCQYLTSRFQSHSFTSPSSTSVAITAVFTKFLANCGTAVWTPCSSENRASATSSKPEEVDPDNIKEGFEIECNDSLFSPFPSLQSFSRLINAAIEHLMKAKAGSIKEVEEGLVHGCAALFSLGESLRVREIYHSLPELRETSSSVAACVAIGDPTSALEALSKLGYSQSRGWVYIPAGVSETIFSVSHLVGYKGTTKNVEELYKALIAFQNKGMLIANYMETVLRGVTLRMKAYQSEVSPSTSASLASFSSLPHCTAGHTRLSPRKIVSDIIPLIDITLQMLGDDVNADAILSLIESAVRWTATPFAVPLIVGLLTLLRRVANQHISLLPFFTREDSSTNHMPFLQYFVLCTIRDSRRLGRKDEEEVYEHLVNIWGVDGKAVRRRSSLLSPPYKLWRCSGCGRPNSDRFNYCACSALRNGFILCPVCHYGQDERWPVCLSCGGDMKGVSCARMEMTSALDDNKSSGPCSSSTNSFREVIPAVVRKSWTCAECGANNPARQVLLCFRCSKLTGPLATVYRQRNKGKPNAPPVSSGYPSGASFCAPSSSLSMDTKQVGFASPVRNPSPLSCPSSSFTSSFCQCSFGTFSNTTYTTCIGFCHNCRIFRNNHSKCTSFVWRCSSCKHLRSSLERSCPRCPHVECVPFLFSHAVEDSRYCRHCQHVYDDPFIDRCSSCGKTQCLDVSLPATCATEKDLDTATATTSQEDNGGFPCCVHCNRIRDTYPKSILCAHCLLINEVRFPSTVCLKKDEQESTMESALLSLTDPEVLNHTLGALRDGLEHLFRSSSNSVLPSFASSPFHSKTRESSLPKPLKDKSSHDKKVIEREEKAPFFFLTVTDSEMVKQKMKGVVKVLHLFKEHYFRSVGRMKLSSRGTAQHTEGEVAHIESLHSRNISCPTGVRDGRTMPSFPSSTEGAQSSSSIPISSKGLVALSGDTEMLCSYVRTTLEFLDVHIPSSIMARYAAAHFQQLSDSMMLTRRSASPTGTTSSATINATNPACGCDSFPVPARNSISPPSEEQSRSYSCEWRSGETERALLPREGKEWTKRKCILCLGSHPQELCGFHTPLWCCETCGKENRNAEMDFSRYCCMNCLSLRPLVRELQPSTCWTCTVCQRSNLCFERYCIFCGCDKEILLSNEFLPSSLSHPHSSNRACEESHTTPFLPARCAVCQLVYLEPCCPRCSPKSHQGSYLPEVHGALARSRVPKTTISGEEQRGDLPLRYLGTFSSSITSLTLSSTALHSPLSKQQQCLQSTLSTVSLSKRSSLPSLKSCAPASLHKYKNSKKETDEEQGGN